MRKSHKFSDASLEQLKTCHDDLQYLFNIIIQYYDCKIIEGHRNQEKQDLYFSQRKTKLKWPNGNHNQYPSMAIDVAPYPIDWKDSRRFYHFGGFVQGIAIMLQVRRLITHKIRWGGDWDGDNDLNDQTFDDLVHFELVKIKSNDT